MRHLEEVCFAPGIGSTLKERAGEGKGVVGPVSERREPMQEKDSGAKDLPGASSISGFSGATDEKGGGFWRRGRFWVWRRDSGESRCRRRSCGPFPKKRRQEKKDKAAT